MGDGAKAKMIRCGGGAQSKGGNRDIRLPLTQSQTPYQLLVAYMHVTTRGERSEEGIGIKAPLE